MATQLLFLLALLSVSVSGNLHTLLYPSHDGNNRVNTMTADVFTQALTTSPHMVVMVKGAPAHLDVITEQMLQVTAQLLEGKGVSVTVLDAGTKVEALQTLGLQAGGVYVFREGKAIPYHGYRSAENLISFIKQANKSILTLIDGKPAKKAFDATESTRVIGYFIEGSPELLEYEQAAIQQHPGVPFFVVYDPVVAPHCKLNMTGQILVVEPYKKHGTAILANPATAADISAHLTTQNPSVVKRITKDNIHTLQPLLDGGAQPVAFVRKRSPEGYMLDKMLRKMAKHGVNTTSTTVYVIDPDDFPALEDHWNSTFAVDVSKPSIGLLNLTHPEYKSRFVNLTELLAGVNSSSQYEPLHQWLLEVESGQFTVEPPPPIPVCCAEPTQECLDACEAAAAYIAQQLADQAPVCCTEPTQECLDACAAAAAHVAAKLKVADDAADPAAATPGQPAQQDAKTEL